MPLPLFRDTVPTMTPVPASRRVGYAASPGDAAVHAEALASVPAFREIETGGEARAAPPSGPLRIAAWNLERGLFPAESAALLRQEGAGLVLLSEVDKGCHRTGQRHATRAVAEALGHRYAFGLEFLELATMPAPVDFPGNPAENTLGFHGNAFTTALPFRDPVLIRLDEVADWFVEPKGGQKRIGTRMALAAVFRHEGRDFVGCSVHLESRADFAGRDRQMVTLLAALDELAGSLPVVIGGDLNTQVAAGGHDDPRELLFETARRQGYDWRAANLASPSTRPSRWSPGAEQRQLDWFCTRGCHVSDPHMVPALAPDGTVLTDHDLISLAVRFG
ncbi:endonuclease/exonuclease/phosphatase family protein [Teichococcus coralli]|nr:endonuclease/exonuclease/phosphatase family protein [Pseudoroseomonas coralli]